MADAYDHTTEDDSDLEYLEEMPDIKYGDEPRNKVKRGDQVNLNEKDPTINELMIGVGWDLKKFDAKPLDLDVSVFLLGVDGKTRVDEDFVFYNNHVACDGALRHMGDSRTGAGEGDDEIIMLNLNQLPFDIAAVSFAISIYDMEYEGHDFSMVKNVYFRIVNKTIDAEICRFELDDELTGNQGLLIGELERVGPEWFFKASGTTVSGGLGKIASDYGIIVLENMK